MEICIEGLVKTFGGRTALDIETCRISQGEIVGLVGNNGAGKTTLFRLIMDLIKPDKGYVDIGEYRVNETEDWKTHVAAFIDAGFLIDFLTPEEYFEFIARIYNITQADLELRLAAFNRFMGGEILGQKKYIRNFSAGNKQKIGIIGVLITGAPVIILDEPFNYLDPTSQLLIRNILGEYNKNTGATVFVSSHNLNHVADLCRRVILLKESKILHDMDNTEKQAEAELLRYFSIDGDDIL